MAADAISRDKLVSLFKGRRDLERSPSVIPQMLPQLVGPGSPDWTLLDWGWAVQEFYHMALAPSTTRSYESAPKHFLLFCQDANFSPTSVSQELLCG